MELITAPIRLFTNQNTSDNSIKLMSLSIQYHNTEFYLPVGALGDSIYIFKESIALYVLSINEDLGRISLNTFMAPEADAITTLVLHTPEEIEELVGQNWKQQNPTEILGELFNHLI